MRTSMAKRQAFILDSPKNFGKGNLIRFAVSVGVSLFDGLKDLIKVFHGLGLFQAKLVQPVLTVEIQLAAGDGGALADESDVAVRIADAAAHIRVTVHGPEIWCVRLVQHFIQRLPCVFI